MEEKAVKKVQTPQKQMVVPSRERQQSTVVCMKMTGICKNIAG